jgi:hypothetical protein
MRTRKTICVLLGVACVTVAIFLFGDALTEHARHDWPRAQRINCENNLKQIGVSFRTWALDNADRYPCNVATNAGGAMEVCVTGADGFVNDPAPIFQVMSNELSIPLILVCPHDKSKKAAPNFPTLTASNITYRPRSGPEISDTNPTNILGLCPICGNVLLCDGSVKIVKDERASGNLFEDWRFDQVGAASLARALLIAVIGGALIRIGCSRRNGVGGTTKNFTTGDSPMARWSKIRLARMA